MKRSVMAISAFGIIFFATTGAAWAQEQAQPAADLQVGKETAEACAGCHGAAGISEQPDVPHLSGQHAAYIRNGLLSYRQGHRQGTKMADIVTSLSEQDIANVAAYYGSLKRFDQIVKRSLPVSPPAEDPFAALRDAVAECAACHGEDGNSDIPGMPSLAGQHAPYLISAMKQYQDGTRKNEDMKAFLEGLSNARIEDIAYFYAAMEPKQAEAPAEGDPIAGLAVTTPCVNCHGEDGNSEDPNTPRLAGLDADYLLVAADGYLSGDRDQETVRNALDSLKESELVDMAAYYATREPAAQPIRKPLTTAEWVEKCDRCHGTAGHSTDPRFPIIAGQNEAYLVNALKRYHGRKRDNAMMFAMSFLMSESDIDKLAYYYAGQGAD